MTIIKSDKTSIFILLILIINLLYQSVNAQTDTVKVLFLGNSFTAANNLPNIFEQLSTKAGKKVLVEDVSPGGFTLNNHSTNTSSINQIFAKKWDYVVLQEQSQIPSIIPNRETLMYPYAIMLDSLIHQNTLCTQTTFFMTWGHKNGNLGLPVGSDTYEDMQQRLRSGYMTIADSLDALVSPVGWAWRYVRQNYPNLELYSADDYHPEMTGTYLAACVFYATFFEQSPLGIGYDAGLDPSIVQNLQFAAGKIVLDSLTLWNHGIYNPNPTADFSYQTLTSSAGFQFFSNSTNADSLFWDFGDGTYSLAQNPIHNYNSAGTFLVKLIAKNECYSDTITKNIVVIIDKIMEINQADRAITFPNPATNSIKIQFSKSDYPVNIQLISTDGKIIKTSYKAVNTNQIEIDISSLNTGIYILSIQNKAGENTYQKIIKQ